MARLVSVLLILLFLLLILGTVQSRPPPTPNPPAADFSGTPLSGLAPLPVTFTDVSTGLVTWRQWDFGDGPIVYANDSLSVSHTYRVPGSYSVSLTVGNPSGRDTQTRYAFVTVAPNGSPPSAFFVPDRAFGTAPFRVQFTDRSRGEPVQWNWDFGDGGYSHEKDPVYTFNEKGRYKGSIDREELRGGGHRNQDDYCYSVKTRIYTGILLPPLDPGWNPSPGSPCIQ